LTIDGEVRASKTYWPGELFAGQCDEAKLTSKPSGSRRGLANTSSGQEVLVDHLPDGCNEGQSFPITITRAPVAERGRFKKAQGRFLQEPAQGPTSWLYNAKDVGRFASGCWEDIWYAASSGEVEFDGGSLVFSVTPAMTLIDVDGMGPPKQLALAAVAFIARWIPLFELGGSIGIDFPTIEAKADRKAVDAALDQALADYPHERTAMNGFGFVQIVARLEGPSLLHRFASSRVGMCARMALRQAELAQGSGSVLLLTIHPALKPKLKDEWVDELARRTGKQVRIEIDPGIALEAPQGQIVEQ